LSKDLGVTNGSTQIKFILFCRAAKSFGIFHRKRLQLQTKMYFVQLRSEKF
jgi:hypothetical protein